MENLKKQVKTMLIDAVGNSNDLRVYMQDILTHGCVTGAVGGLIYYKDTVRFYEEHKDAIWELIFDMKAGESCLSFILSLNGANNVASDEQFKNLLAWFSFEEVTRLLYREKYLTEGDEL